MVTVSVNKRSLTLKANKTRLFYVFTGLTALLIHLEVKMPEDRYK